MCRKVWLFAESEEEDGVSQYQVIMGPQIDPARLGDHAEALEAAEHKWLEGERLGLPARLALPKIIAAFLEAAAEEASDGE